MVPQLAVMNWEALSAVAEIVGAVAVVVSLLYLAAQVRQNTNVTRSSVRHGVTERAIAHAAPLVASEELTRLLQRCIDGEQLQGHENMRLHAWAYMVLREWENIHYQHLSGLLSDADWAAFKTNLKLLLTIPTCRAYWDAERDIYTDAFKGEIEEILREPITSKESVIVPKQTGP